LVDILKSFAVEQSKIDQELQALTASQGKVDQVLQGQKELDATQKKITEALKDLRRKANVNISRTDAILKKIKKQK
jgi:small-conductance mechanosensitive channel